MIQVTSATPELMFELGFSLRKITQGWEWSHPLFRRPLINCYATQTEWDAIAVPALRNLVAFKNRREALNPEPITVVTKPFRPQGAHPKELLGPAVPPDMRHRRGVHRRTATYRPEVLTVADVDYASVSGVCGGVDDDMPIRDLLEQIRLRHDLEEAVQFEPEPRPIRRYYSGMR